MSDEWLEKCLKAARTPRGQTPSAFDDPQDLSAPQDPGMTPEAQGIEIGWTDDAIVLLLRTPGEKPKLIKLGPDDALTVAENLKKASMLLMFKNSLGASGKASKGLPRGFGPSDEPEPDEPEPVS